MWTSTKVYLPQTVYVFVVEIINLVMDNLICYWMRESRALITLQKLNSEIYWLTAKKQYKLYSLNIGILLIGFITYLLSIENH